MTRRELIVKLSDCLEEDMDKPVWVTVDGDGWVCAAPVNGVDTTNGEVVIVGEYE